MQTDKTTNEGRPFLSVVIPVYNVQDYLSRCLDGLLAVTMELEVLLVDDGSTDKSLQLCLDYQRRDPRVRVLHQENAGPSAARNLALRHARGEYVGFADSDDWIDPKAFSHHIELLRQHPVDLWISDFHRVADNGCVLDRVCQIRETEEPILDKDYLLDFLAAKDCVWNVWRCFFRRAFLEEKGLSFAEGYHCAEDLEFMVRALCAAESFGFFHRPWYSYRVNYSTTLTRSYSAERVRHLMTMLQRAAESLPASPGAEMLKAKLAREYILNLSLLYEVAREERPAVLRELRAAKELAARAAGAYAAAAAVIRFIGIPRSAAILYRLKGIKRLRRAGKTRSFHGGK